MPPARLLHTYSATLRDFGVNEPQFLATLGATRPRKGRGSGGGHKHRPSNVGERTAHSDSLSPHGRPRDARGRGSPRHASRGSILRRGLGGGCGRSFRRRRRPSSTVICACAPSGQALRRRGTPVVESVVAVPARLSRTNSSACRPSDSPPPSPPAGGGRGGGRDTSSFCGRLHLPGRGGDPYATRSGGGGGGGADLWSSSVMSVVRRNGRARPPRTPLWPRPAPLPGPPPGVWSPGTGLESTATLKRLKEHTVELEKALSQSFGTSVLSTSGSMSTPATSCTATSRPRTSSSPAHSSASSSSRTLASRSSRTDLADGLGRRDAPLPLDRGLRRERVQQQERHVVARLRPLRALRPPPALRRLPSVVKGLPRAGGPGRDGPGVLGFTKVNVPRGGSAQGTITVPLVNLAGYDADAELGYTAEPVAYTIWVAQDASEVPAEVVTLTVTEGGGRGGGGGEGGRGEMMTGRRR